jgi:group I intron endonuclease
MKKISGVYTIQNIITNKIYIGATKDLYNRLCMHKWKLRVGIHDNVHLQNSFNKYKEENFIFETLEECDSKYIYSQENYWCNMLDTHNRKYGYNIDPTCPEGKCAVSNETKVKMSHSAIKRKVMAYTLYGEFYQSFSDLYKCAEHFNTVAPNIHRKMNIKFFKKNLIDSISSKFIFLDENESIEDVKIYWSNIFNHIKLYNGKYKIYDCFHRYIGTINSKSLANILNISINAITTSIKRNTYLKTLKIER